MRNLAVSSASEMGVPRTHSAAAGSFFKNWLVALIPFTDAFRLLPVCTQNGPDLNRVTGKRRLRD